MSETLHTPVSFIGSNERLDEIRHVNKDLIDEIIVANGNRGKVLIFRDGGEGEEPRKEYMATFVPRETTFSSSDIADNPFTHGSLELRKQIRAGEEGDYNIIFHDYVVLEDDSYQEFETTTYVLHREWEDSDAFKIEANGELTSWKPDKIEELDLSVYLLAAKEVLDQKTPLAA